MRTWRLPKLVEGQVLVHLSTIILLFLVVGYPLLRLLGESFLYAGHFSLENYRQIAIQPANYIALGRTLSVGLAVTMLATAAGAFLAWLVARTDLPGRQQLKTWLMLPYLIPPFIGAFAWTQLLGPAGYLNKFYQSSTGAEGVLFNIYGPGGIILVLAVHSYPLVYLTVVGAFARIDPALEEAARIAGATRWQVLRDICFIFAINFYQLPAELIAKAVYALREAEYSTCPADGTGEPRASGVPPATVTLTKTPMAAYPSSGFQTAGWC